MKKLIVLGMLLSLMGCGLLFGPLSFLDPTPDYIDLSDSESVATIRGETRNVLFAHIICSIRCPRAARKVTVNAGPINIVAACQVDGGRYNTRTARFSFDAIAGHDYRIRMLVPGSGNIVLVDDTINKIIRVHKKGSTSGQDTCRWTRSLHARLSN